MGWQLGETGLGSAVQGGVADGVYRTYWCNGLFASGKTGEQACLEATGMAF